MSKWLITGGCGFIGVNLVSKLLQRGEGIRVLDNCSVCGLEHLSRLCPSDVVAMVPNPPGRGMVQFMQGDITDERAACAACDGMDNIVHLAANTGVPKSVADPALDFKSNVFGTFQMLEAARKAGAKRFIFASSGAPAGNVKPPITEEMAPHPISPYGASKLAGEGYCSAYANCFGLETVALRFSNVYGPWSAHKTSVVAKLISGAIRGENWEFYGDGLQTRDYLHVDDLTRAIVLAGDTPGIGGQTFQIATGKESSLVELASLISERLATHGIFAPSPLHKKPRIGDMQRNYADPEKAARLLGWRALVGLKEGVSGLVDWFISQGSIRN